jgi:hypothetical protein
MYPLDFSRYSGPANILIRSYGLVSNDRWLVGIRGCAYAVSHAIFASNFCEIRSL